MSRDNASVLVCLAAFSSCSCEEFHGLKKHFSIKINVTTLKLAKAVAISYMWGEFDRSPMRLGHLHEAPSSTIQFALGKEWEAQDFVKRLVQLTSQHGACWIDQVCIPQNATAIRQVLASIPVIFKALPVVVLFPGSLCKCLKVAYAGFREIEQEKGNQESEMTGAEVSQATDKLMEALTGMNCLNANGMCSWTNRVWPLQELRYSSSVTVIWASDKAAKCLTVSSLPDNAQALSSYSRLLYSRMATAHDISEEEMIWAIRMQTRIFCDNIWSLVVANDSDISQPLWKDAGTVARFLLGETGKIGMGSNKLEFSTNEEWAHFFSYLSILSRLENSASDAKDYILSVWIDWSSYKIPENFLELTLFELLNNAIQQVYEQTDALVLSNCPSGLFGLEQNTFECYEGLSQLLEKAQTVRDVYGPFKWNTRVTSDDRRRLPLFVKPLRTMSLGDNAQIFEEFMVGKDIVEMVKQVVLMFYDLGDKHFKSMIRQSVLSWACKAISAAQNQAALLHRCMAGLISNPKDIEKFEDSLPSSIRNWSTKVVEEATFLLLCNYFCINAEQCHERGVKIIFSRLNLPKDRFAMYRIPACIGLVNGDSFEQARKRKVNSLTVAIDKRNPLPFYEILRWPESTLGQHAVIGIWMPLREEVEVEQVGALITNEDPNAFII